MHPYLRRRNGEEEVTYIHPLTEPCLKKTLGVPLFQEQLMQLAVDCAGFSAAEADQLRQAMGSKRSQARMERMRERLMAGMAERGITGDTAEEIYTKLQAFSNFGFPESHSVSFAYLVYSSSWIKYHYPAEFAAVAVERAADGVLLAALDRARRAPPRRAGARPRSQRVEARRDARTAHARRRADRPAAARFPRRTVAPRGPARSAERARSARRVARPHRRRTGRARVHRPRRLRAPYRRDGRPGRGAGDGRRVRRLLRPVAPRRVVGRGRARYRAVRTRVATGRWSRRCPASSPVPTRPRCRA